MFHALALALIAAVQAPASGGPKQYDDAHQIFWQRSLEDALAISKAEQRPLLIAVNADGESASERIVRERYRDPAFVASTRSFVCVAASYFRHTPRDYDDQGRRIPCPRFGEVTCGEHMALEPATHDRYLKGVKIELFGETTERISPRHVLIQPDGTKSFDMYLEFDLRDVDRALAQWAAKAPPVGATTGREPISARARLAYEDGILHGASLVDAWSAFLAHSRGDRGWVDGLRRFLPRAAELDTGHAAWVSEFHELAVSTNTNAPVAAALRDRLLGAGSTPGAAGSGADAHLIRPLVSVARFDAGMNTLVLSYVAAGSSEDGEQSFAVAALHDLVDGKTAQSVVDSLSQSEKPWDPAAFLAHMRSASVAPKFSDRVQEPLPASAELESALDQADAAVARAPGNADAQAALGRVSLQLARRRVQDGASGVELLLEDARVQLDQALKAKPADVGLLLERAHVANMQSRFDQQEYSAMRAVVALRAKMQGSEPKPDHDFIEAMRWLGDACARRLGERSGKNAIDEALGILHGARSLALAAASSEADSTDWLSLGSFFGALGRSREHIAFDLEGLRRFPASDALRADFAGALWNVGRPDLLVSNSAWLAAEYADHAASQWYAGYALVLAAESLRRGEDPDAAIAAYQRSVAYFRRAIELEPKFKDSSEHYLALGALGQGFAHLLVDRRAQAAQCVAEAASIQPAIVLVRDGLDREGVDLIDGVLEWHATGDNSLDAIAWLEELQRANPGNAFWPRSISDSELREAYRASGRNDDAAAGHYFDAAIAAARAAHAIDASDASTHALAQALTAQAERLLDHGAPELEAIRVLLGEAARLTGRSELAAGAGLAELQSLAAEIRTALGAARPVFRPGR
jgi:tetratricopeptide (TPR) repeat protein